MTVKSQLAPLSLPEEGNICDFHVSDQILSPLFCMDLQIFSLINFRFLSSASVFFVTFSATGMP